MSMHSMWIPWWFSLLSDLRDTMTEKKGTAFAVPFFVM